MQKKTKKIIMLTILLLIILAIILLIQNTTKQMPQPLTEQAKANYTTQIGNQTYDITHAVLEPNEITPTISAGMIPIKWNGTNFVITTFDDTNWYDYSIGQPAYIMLNDGYYQSELIQNMQGKELAENSVGNDAIVVPNVTDNNPTIYMYIPRFAYNTQGEILYIKQGCSVAGTYAIPEIFVYQTEKRDFSLAGIWVEYTPLASTSTVNTKISNMQGENNKYGFIANTIGVNAVNEPSYKTTIETYIAHVINGTTGASFPTDSITDANVVGNGALAVPQTNDTDENTVGASIARPQINESTNLNRTILKITNSNQPEPIKANAYYDETEEKIKIEVTYRTNAIVKILNKTGKELSTNSTTADTGDEIIGNKTYRFIIIDNIGNIKEISTEVSGLDIYIIENEDDLKLFRDAVNSNKTTSNTKAYQIADVKMNEGKYTINEETGDITFAEDAEKWLPIGNSSKKYSGTYDGQGHTISGIYINATADYQGLFGYYGGTSIKGLGLINSKILSTGQNVGGIIGTAAYGNCIIENCYNTSNVTGKNIVGGIVGNQAKKIINCYNSGEIQGQDKVGGISGVIGEDSQVYNCYNVGNIYQNNGGNVATPVGGIVGTNSYGRITNCYNLGDVKGARTSGGIVGNNGNTYRDTKNSTVLNCVNASDNVIGYTRQTGKICGSTTEMGRLGSCIYYKNVSSLSGIGRILTSGSTEYNSDTGCIAYSDMSFLPTVLSVINSDNAFVEDTNNINNGYPILAWQLETEE